MRTADSFTLDEVPDRKGSTGNRKASLIPVIRNTAWKTCVFIVVFHGVYFIYQVASGHRVLSVNSTYPFDWTVSPYYELVNILQVA